MIEPGPSDSAAFVLEFADGMISTGSRLLVMAYDSSGSPLYASIRLIVRPDSASERAQLLAAKFTGPRGGTRMRVIGGQVDSSEVATAADSAAALPRGAQVLTKEELAQAYDLSVWLWNHRCTATRE
jgi:hypothetical protein